MGTTTKSKSKPAHPPKKRARVEPDAAGPAVLGKAAAKKALARETTALVALRKRAEDNGWEIGRRLNQIAELGLHIAAGYKTIADYASDEIGIGRTRVFQWMKIAGAYSQRVAHAYSLDKLERALRYIDATPEDETPADVPKLQVRVPAGKRVVRKPFAKATIRELEAAARHEKSDEAPLKPSAVLSPHVAALGHVNAVLDRSVGRPHAAMANATLRSADGMVVLEVRGVPFALAAKAFRAMAAALEQR